MVPIQYHTRYFIIINRSKIATELYLKNIVVELVINYYVSNV